MRINGLGTSPDPFSFRVTAKLQLTINPGRVSVPRFIHLLECAADDHRVDLEAVKAGTHITLTNRRASREQRNAMVSCGAEAGAKAALECLAGLLRKG